MDDKIFGALEGIKKELLSKLDNFKDDFDKKLERLVTSCEENQNNITQLNTHLIYTKEKFEEIITKIEREDGIIWREIEGIKSEFITLLNNTMKTERDARQQLMETERDARQQLVETEKKAREDADISIGDKNSIKVWAAVAMTAISAIAALITAYSSHILSGK